MMLTMADRSWELIVFPDEDWLHAHRPWQRALSFAGLLVASMLQLLMLVTTGRTLLIPGDRRRADGAITR